MLFDGGGNFLAARQNTVNWSGSAGGIPDLFKEHYGANLISGSQVTINDYSDEKATQLIASYIAAKTVVIIAPEKSAQGFNDLKLRTRAKTTPYGQGEKGSEMTDKTTRYVFTGERSEPKLKPVPRTWLRTST